MDVSATWSKFYLTDKGIALRQKAIAEGLEVFFTRGQIGQNIPRNPDDVWSLEKLVSPIKAVPIKRSYSLESTHHMTLHIDNKDYLEEIFMREIGVFAKLRNKAGDGIGEEILYGYAFTEHGYELIPCGSELNRVWDIGLDTNISKNSTVQIIYDGRNVYVTPDELDNYYQLLAPDYLLVKINHGLNCYPPYIFLTHLRYGAGIGPAGAKPAGGSDSEAFPAKAIYHDRNSLTIKTVKFIAEIGTNPQVQRLSLTEFIVTFEGNNRDSLYIQLNLPQMGEGTGQTVSVSNLIFSNQPPEDKSILWGQYNE